MNGTDSTPAIFVVRTAGIPRSSVQTLRFDKTTAAITDFVNKGARLESTGKDLADALYTLIDDSASGPAKGKLVGLRRALHRCRVPADGEWNIEIARMLPEHVAARVRRWVAELRDIADEPGRVRQVLADELPAKLIDLRAAAAAPMFRHALLQASGPLSAEVDKWLADETRKLKRATLFRLARYLSRAATKTSPYSTFMFTAPGVWTDDRRSGGEAAAPYATSVLEVDRGLLKSIQDAIVQRWDLRPRLPVRVNPSLLERDGKLRLLRPAFGEPIVTIDDSPAIQACLRILRTRTPRSLAELTDALSERTGDTDAASAFVEQLIAGGLIEVVAPVADNALRPIESFLAWCRDTVTADPEFDRVAAGMTELSDALNRPVPPEDVQSHRARTREVHHAAQHLNTELNAGMPDDDTARKLTFHENGVHTQDPLARSAAASESALADLRVACQWLAVQDWTLPLRRVLGEFLQAGYGEEAEVSLLVLHKEVQAMVAGDLPDDPATATIGRALVDFLHVWTPEGAPLHDHRSVASVSELERLREQATALLLAHADPESGDITVPREELVAAMRDWPAWLAPISSLACYLQQAGEGQRDLIVVNTIGPGHGRERARLSRLLASSGEPELPTTASTQPGVVAAELTGTFGRAMNLRLPVCEYDIDYPGATGDRPAEERISVGELVVRRDADTGLARLYCDRIGKEVVPAHLGMMADAFLPALARFLVHGFGGTYLVHQQRRIPLIPRARAESGRIKRRPRVRIGDVVLQRAGWVVPPDLLPVRRSDEDDAAHLIRLHRWLREHDMPQRAFVWMIKDYANHLDRLANKNRKPLFIDFANWFLVMTFERLISDSECILIVEEALPDPVGGEPGTPESADHVTELVMELGAGQPDQPQRRLRR